MPPQQISPSAARRSPNSSATVHASRKVSAIFVVLLRRTRGGVDSDDAGLPNARRTKLRANLARLPDLCHELPALVGVPHRRTAAGRPPDRRDQRPDEQIPLADPIREPFQVVVARVDADVWIEQEQVHAVELHAVDRGVHGQVQHRVEVDRRLRVGPLPHQPGPHRVV